MRRLKSPESRPSGAGEAAPRHVRSDSDVVPSHPPRPVDGAAGDGLEHRATTTITSIIEGDPEPVPPISFVFTFDRDEGAYCKVWGLRYQVDAGAGDLRSAYKRFLGKRPSVTVEVADSTGAKASSTRVVQIADKLLCPDGTDACNP